MRFLAMFDNALHHSLANIYTVPFTNCPPISQNLVTYIPGPHTYCGRVACRFYRFLWRRSLSYFLGVV